MKQAAHTCTRVIFFLWYFIQNSVIHIGCSYAKKSLKHLDHERLKLTCKVYLNQNYFFCSKRVIEITTDLDHAEPLLSVISWYVEVCSAVSISKYWYTTPLYWRPDIRCRITQWITILLLIYVFSYSWSIGMWSPELDILCTQSVVTRLLFFFYYYYVCSFIMFLNLTIFIHW